MKGRLGIFGGTFNPVHIGHLRLAEDVREEFNLERIVFIPTNVPPHKEVHDDAGPSHRCAMVRLAISGNEYFQCDDIELKRGGTSYTIDTINYMYDTYRFSGKPYFIIGSDLITGIQTWKDVEDIKSKVDFIVLLRENRLLEGNQAPPFHYFENRILDINSSELRRRIREGKSIRYLVTETVHRYINEKKLYRG
jgi:nicotinate-nucleotide adenylyltransferase